MGPLTVALLTMMQEHPLPALLRAGVPVTINSVRRHPHTSATPHLCYRIPHSMPLLPLSSPCNTRAG